MNRTAIAARYKRPRAAVIVASHSGSAWHIAHLTQQSANISHGQNGKISRDVCAHCELGPFSFIEWPNYIHRHVRFLRQQLDGAFVLGTFLKNGIHSEGSLPDYRECRSALAHSVAYSLFREQR